MTPKERARDILEKIEGVLGYSVPTHDDPFYKETIQIGIICVDEILSSFDGFMDARKHFRHELEIDAERYWQQVKKEINSLCPPSKTN